MTLDIPIENLNDSKILQQALQEVDNRPIPFLTNDNISVVNGVIHFAEIAESGDKYLLDAKAFYSVIWFLNVMPKLTIIKLLI